MVCGGGGGQSSVVRGRNHSIVAAVSALRDAVALN